MGDDLRLGRNPGGARMRLRILMILMLIAVALSLVVLMLLPGNAGSWYATFDYDGETYAVSSQYEGGSWPEAVRFCASLGPAWRLPTLGEAMKMRVDYRGHDPFQTVPPCEEGGRGELWTATQCSIGAYEIYRLDTTIVCEIRGYCDCDNAAHVCCLHKTRHRAVHFCPVARCVKRLEVERTLWLPLISRSGS